MEKFELISTLKTWCETNDWLFLYGENFIQNWEATRKKIAVDQFIFGCSFNASPTYRNSAITSVFYSGQIMLGRKFETDTRANLDELHIQKYERRLDELTKLLAYNFGAFACDNELTINSLNMRYDLNKFDECIDFVAANVTLTQ